MNTSRRLNIGIDGRLLSYQRGMGTVVYQLIHALSKQSDRHQYTVYVMDDEAADQAPRSSRFAVRKLSPRILPVWEQISLPKAAAEDGLDLLHSTANTAPVRLDHRIPLLVTVHDAIFALPRRVGVPAPRSVRQRAGRRYYSAVARAAVRRSRMVATVSAASRADIIERFKLPGEKVRVVPNAPGGQFERMSTAKIDRRLESLNVERPYVLALGASDPRKNTARVMAAFARAVGDVARKERLVIAGVSGSLRTELARLAFRLGLEARVTLKGFVSIEDLAVLYNGAELFAYPSLYEGFGIPVVEAMACGAPVLTSNCSSLPEVAGDAALLVDPGSIEQIAEGMGRILECPQLCDSLRRLGQQQAARFSWTRSAAQLVDLYEEVAA